MLEPTKEQLELLESQSDLFKNKTRSIWNAMKARCYNKKHPSYKNYGHYGIKVCDEWMDKEYGLANFRLWLLDNGYKPIEGKIRPETLTLDRIDGDGAYEPSNCQIITHAENSRKTDRRKTIKPNDKLIFVYTESGSKSIDFSEPFKNHRDAARVMSEELGLKFQSDKIAEVCKGTRISHQGYRFSYGNFSELPKKNTRNHTPFYAIPYDVKTDTYDYDKKVLWTSKKECAEAIGSASTNISKVLSGERNQAKGWYFEYA